MKSPHYHGLDIGRELFDSPLWSVRLPGDGLCVARTVEGAFLILFTSRALADSFIRNEDLQKTENAAAALYSHSREHLLSRILTAAADGIRGMMLNPLQDGQVLDVVGFASLDMDPSPSGRVAGSCGRVLH